MSTTLNIDLDRGTRGDEGHYVTIEGHAVFIADDIGSGAKGRGGKFTRHAIESRLVEHHERHGGGDAQSREHDRMQEASGGKAFTFHKSLPAEVKDYVDQNPAARRLFTVTHDATRAGGEDAMHEHGDRYWHMADDLAGNKARAARETAERSDDPELRFLAGLHGDMEASGTHKGQQGILKAEHLRHGQSFSINGRKFNVEEDPDDGLMLHGGHDFPSTPVAALTQIPIDRHSLKAGSRPKPKADDDIPFSRADLRATLLSQGHLFGTSGIGGQAGLFKKGSDGKAAASFGGDGHWVTIHGAHVLIRHGESVGKALREHFAGTGKVITHEHVGGAVRQIKKQGGVPHVEAKDLQAAPAAAASPAPVDRNAGVVDPNRQTGLFTKDAAGNPVEVGERVGQASLFGNTAKPAAPAKPVDPDAALRKKFDEAATPSMFTPGTPAPVTAASPRFVERATHGHPTKKPGEIIATHADVDAAVKEITAYHKMVKSVVKEKLLAGETRHITGSFFHAEGASRTGQLSSVSQDGLQKKVRLDDGRIVDHHPDMKTTGHDARGYDRYAIPDHIIDRIDQAEAARAKMSAEAKEAEKARISAKVAAGVPAEAVQAFKKYKGDAAWADRKGDAAAGDHIREHGEAIRAGAKARKPDIHPDAQVALTGNTFIHKDRLRAAGFKWNGDRRAWVGRHGNTPNISGIEATQIAEPMSTAVAREPARDRDTAVVNIPLSKRGDIDAQIDRYKADQKRAEANKTSADSLTRKTDKAIAKELQHTHAEALADRIAAKGTFTKADALHHIDQMVKWEPSKARARLEKFAVEQAQREPAEKSQGNPAPDPDRVAQLDQRIQSLDKAIQSRIRITSTTPPAGNDAMFRGGSTSAEDRLWAKAREELADLNARQGALIRQRDGYVAGTHDAEGVHIASTRSRSAALLSAAVDAAMAVLNLGNPHRHAESGRYTTAPQTERVEADSLEQAITILAERQNGHGRIEDAAGNVIQQCRCGEGHKLLVVVRTLPANLSAARDVLYLSASGDMRPAITLGMNLPATHNELPVHYRWVDAAAAKHWVHPRTGTSVDITHTRMDKWVSGIKLARQRGVDLPVCEDHKEEARKSLGAIYDAKREGDRLSLLLGFYGDDSLDVGRRNKLSVGIDPNFKDSHGNKYGEMIRHVAATPIPVIHGQTGFIGASRSQPAEPVYLIAGCDTQGGHHAHDC